MNLICKIFFIIFVCPFIVFSQEWDWMYAYNSPNLAESKKYIEKVVNAKVVYEKPVYYWKPIRGAKKKGENPGIIIYKFNWEKSIVEGKLKIYMPTFHWKYSKGHNTLFASKNGKDWVELADFPPPAYGKASKGLYNDYLPEEIMDTKELWIKVILDSYGQNAYKGGNMTNTAQLSRYNTKTYNRTFELFVVFRP